MIAILKYREKKIYHAIYIKVFSDATVSYLTVSNDDDVFNTNNNETSFPELRRVFEEVFDNKSQEVSVLKYLNF